MRGYCAYGLRIESELSLPEMIPGVGFTVGSADISIRLGKVRPVPTRLDASGTGFWATAAEACHFPQKVGAFLVRHGREIVIDPAPGVEERLLRLSLLGPALALLLHQRGFLIVHASVVAQGDCAVAFLGKNGWGKSTIAAALHLKGYDLVTDDVAAIQLGADGPRVLPSFPQVKLWPEAARLLGGSPDTLPILHPDFDKRGWRAERGFALAPRRLDRIYGLAPGPAPAVEGLEPREACFEILGHWYGHRFGGELLQNGSATRHLQQCAALASQVSMRRLVRSGGSAALLHLADLVDNDLRGLRPNSR